MSTPEFLAQNAKKLAQRKCIAIVAPREPTNFVESVADGILVEGLRMSFKVEKTLTKNPNTCELTITNLSAERRAQLQKHGVRVILRAGYKETVAQIFSGDARTIDHSHDKASWHTKIQCGDGERAFQFARFSETYAPGARVSDVIRDVATALGLDVGNAVAQTRALTGPLDSFVTGYVAHGRASNVLDELLRSVGLTWSIQDGALQVLSSTEAVPGEGLLISASSGLVGSPEYGNPEKKGGPAPLIVKSLLQPTARCGALIALESESHRGTYRITKLSHSGDTAGTSMSERTTSLARVIQGIVDARTAGLRVMLPGRVESYDAATQTAYVKPLLKEQAEGENGEAIIESLPVIPKVPVVFPGSAPFGLWFPLTVGTTVMLHFADRSIDQWLARGVEVDPIDQRRHALPDAVAVPGLHDLKNPWTDVAGQFVYVGKEGETAQFVALANLVLTELNKLRTAINSHTHVLTTTGVDAPLSGGVATANGSACPAIDPVASATVKVKG